jgi:hypothetical protein
VHLCTSQSVGSKVAAPSSSSSLVWDLSQDLTQAPSGCDGKEFVLRAVAETTAQLLATVWHRQSADVKGAILPLTTTASESIVNLLTLGRLLVLTEADQDLGMSILPLFLDLLAGQSNKSQARKSVCWYDKDGQLW